MKALVKKNAEKGIWMQDVALPTCALDEVLIKIHKTAICGTDIHIYHWDEWAQKTVPVPTIIGHEFSGVVVELGNAVKGIKVGDRVSGEGHLTCGICRNCRAGKRHLCRETKGIGYDCDGCFAELAVLPASNVMLLPDNISDEQAAILDPLGNAAHTALSFDVVGEDVLITGAGPTGLMACAIAQKTGARHVIVTDVNDYRLDLAIKMGATRAVNVSKENLMDVQDALGMQEGFDVAFEMSGNPSAYNNMIDMMNHGGRIAMLGIPPGDMAIDWSQVIFKSLFIKGVYGREIFETWYKMIALLQSGLDVGPVITHTFPVAEYQKAFEIMASGQSGKVILDWT